MRLEEDSEFEKSKSGDRFFIGKTRPIDHSCIGELRSVCVRQEAPYPCTIATAVILVIEKNYILGQSISENYKDVQQAQEYI